MLAERKSKRLPMWRIFPEMVKVVPEGRAGRAKVEHFEFTPEMSKHSMLESAIKGNGDYYIPPGRYAKLEVGGVLVMSDTLFERHTNHEFYRRAHGHVLIGGLGLGMIVHAALAKPEVVSVTIVEKNRDVIKLIKPTLPRKSPRDRWTVHGADVFQWRPELGQRFNTIYFDIWSDSSVTCLPEIAKLHRRYANWLDRKDPERWMRSWRQGILKANRDTGRWR